MKFKDSAGIFHDVGMKFKDGSGVWHDVGAKFKDNEGIWHDVYPPVADELILLGAPGTAANWTLSGSSSGQSQTQPTFTKTDYLLKSTGGSGGGRTGGGSWSKALSMLLDLRGWSKLIVSGKIGTSKLGAIRTVAIVNGNESVTYITKNTGNGIPFSELEIPISVNASSTRIRIYAEAGSTAVNSSSAAEFEITSVKLTK